MGAKVKPAPAKHRKGLTEIQVEFDVFNVVTHLVIGDQKDLAPYIRYRHRIAYRDPPDFDCAALYFPRRPRQRRGIIWLPSIPKTAKQIAILTHEMTHAVLDMVRHVGMTLNTKTEEAICYAIGHGVEQVLEAVRK